MAAPTVNRVSVTELARMAGQEFAAHMRALGAWTDVSGRPFLASPARAFAVVEMLPPITGPSVRVGAALLADKLHAAECRALAPLAMPGSSEWDDSDGLGSFIPVASYWVLERVVNKRQGWAITLTQDRVDGPVRLWAGYV